MTSSPKSWDQYSEYLRTDRLLSAQEPRSSHHDEMLFIIFHQVYELWFKQILFELDDIQDCFAGQQLNDHDLGRINSRLGRIILILNNIVHQMRILETMNPQSFVDFREKLETASGFQSWQFRLIEIRLGLRREDRLKFNKQDYDAQMNNAHQALFQQAENNPTLMQQLDEWLARTPFIESEEASYSFWQSYRSAAQDLFKDAPKAQQKFEALFDQKKHTKLQEDGQWHMSWRALQSALFIHIYRHEPALQFPFKILDQLMDIDTLLAKWRYAHALMVQRMVGFSMGTGGSSGYGYLMQTLEKHRIFSDLFSLSAYLIPSHEQPTLPQNISQSMGYNYAQG